MKRLVAALVMILPTFVVTAFAFPVFAVPNGLPQFNVVIYRQPTGFRLPPGTSMIDGPTSSRAPAGTTHIYRDHVLTLSPALLQATEVAPPMRPHLAMACRLEAGAWVVRFETREGDIPAARTWACAGAFPKAGRSTRLSGFRHLTADGTLQRVLGSRHAVFMEANGVLSLDQEGTAEPGVTYQIGKATRVENGQTVVRFFLYP